jgi:RNA polymerase sigma-70 factor (ECF subfamily)
MDARASDYSAFETDLVALIPHLRAFARSLSGNAAQGEDLAQDTLIKALSAQQGFTLGTNMKAWAFMILRNLFYSRLRSSWRTCELDPEFAERSLIAVTNATGALELDEVRRALTMLPPEQREALVLVGAAGLSYEEVGEITGVAIGTVKSRVNRARNRLARILADGDIAQDGAPPHAAMAAIFRQVDLYTAVEAAS